MQFTEKLEKLQEQLSWEITQRDVQAVRLAAAMTEELTEQALRDLDIAASVLIYTDGRQYTRFIRPAIDKIIAWKPGFFKKVFFSKEKISKLRTQEFSSILPNLQLDLARTLKLLKPYAFKNISFLESFYQLKDSLDRIEEIQAKISIEEGRVPYADSRIGRSVRSSYSKSSSLPRQSFSQSKSSSSSYDHSSPSYSSSTDWISSTSSSSSSDSYSGGGGDFGGGGSSGSWD